LDKLDLEADDSLNKMLENDVPLVSNNCGNDKINGSISFGVPQVVKGAKNKRAKSVVEKKTGKKKKTSQKKGTNTIHYTIRGSYDNVTMPTFINDLHGQPSTMDAPLIQGGYTN
ncbi:hypothetical protein BS78_09G019100, partial [Paspalum vaginatum]